MPAGNITTPASQITLQELLDLLETQGVIISGKDDTLASRVILTDASGRIITLARGVAAALTDAATNSPVAPQGDTGALKLPVYLYAFNNTDWDRIRGNTQGLFAQGNIASDVADAGNPLKIGAVFLNESNQPTFTTGRRANLQADISGALRAAPNYTPPANILADQIDSNATIAATTLITIPAGRTWKGMISANIALSKAAAATGNGSGSIDITISGAGATPAAGRIMYVTTKVGANAATGTVGTQSSTSSEQEFCIAAPSGNSVAVQVAMTITSATGAEGSVTAAGELL